MSGTTDVRPNEVAEDVFLFTGTDVNWVILRAGTELTLVDAGWEADTQAVERSIRSLGRRPQDLRAVLLTHGHADHTGALNHLHDTYGVPIYMSATEVPNARGEDVETGGPRDLVSQIYRPQALRWAAEVVRIGGLKQPFTPSAQAFPTDGRLDVPGSPIPVATPGHTSGHTSYLLPGARAVLTGDALVSAHPTLRGTGPQLLPHGFTHDQRSAVASLSVLRGLDADLFVPGHGPAWYGSMDDAVQRAMDAMGDRGARERTPTTAGGPNEERTRS